jgi:hypothetical protein
LAGPSLAARFKMLPAKRPKPVDVSRRRHVCKRPQNRGRDKVVQVKRRNKGRIQLNDFESTSATITVKSKHEAVEQARKNKRIVHGMTGPHFIKNT